MNSVRRRTMLRMSAALVAPVTIFVSSANAQSSTNYPNRPIRVVVGFTAGGMTDLVARTIALKWGERLGQPMVIDNRPGANNVIATTSVANAPADGYTLQFVGAGHALNAALYKNLPYNSVTSFEPIGTATVTSPILVVSPTLKVNSVQELVALIKAHPGKFNYASASTSAQLTMELFKQVTGTDIVHVPYKGTAETVPELVAGRVHIAIDSIVGLLPTIREKRLRPLAVGTPTRSPLLPEVPTFAEIGLGGFIAPAWTGFLAPAKTPSAIVAKLNSTLNSALQDTEVQGMLAQQASVVKGSTPEEFRQLIAADAARWNKVVEEAKIPKI